MTEHIGPSLWHGREVNVCTRCKYLRCDLIKSGKDPQYEHFCMHPDIMSGTARKEPDEKLLQRVSPAQAATLKLKFAEHAAFVSEHGDFISNDSTTPETPEWCPVTKK